MLYIVAIPATLNQEVIAATTSDTNSSQNSTTNATQVFHIPNYNQNNVLSDTYNNTPISTNVDMNDNPNFDEMSIEELNAYIDKKVEENKALSIYDDSKVIVTTSVIKQMWKAAAIARKMGYTCSAKLIDCSASGKNYTEWSRGGGLFASKIKRTSAYKKAKKRNSKSIEFTKRDSKDLYYALHLVKSNFHYTKKHPVHISDTFDFKLMTSYRSPFTAAVNNWGYLCSKTGVLYPSKINIYF